MSEGAGALLLERFDDAERRGANIYAEVLGSALSTTGTTWRSPSPRRQASPR